MPGCVMLRQSLLPASSRLARLPCRLPATCQPIKNQTALLRDRLARQSTSIDSKIVGAPSLTHDLACALGDFRLRRLSAPGGVGGPGRDGARGWSGGRAWRPLASSRGRRRRHSADTPRIRRAERGPPRERAAGGYTGVYTRGRPRERERGGPNGPAPHGWSTPPLH